MEREGELPIILIGSSWGAWLSYLFAARHPSMVKKLILVASGPFEEKYVSILKETRMNRLNEDEKNEMQELLKELNELKIQNRSVLFAKIGTLFTKTDSYKPINYTCDTIEFQPEVYSKIWEEAKNLRASGTLLELGKNINCPVVAIHGDHDPPSLSWGKRSFISYSK